MFIAWQLSSFCPLSDNNADKRTWNEKLGKCDFTLACVLLLNIQSSSKDQSHLFVKCLPNPASLINSTREFTSWIMWGSTGEETPSFFSHSTELALILLKHGQYDAVEVFSFAFDLNDKTSLSLWNDCYSYEKNSFYLVAWRMCRLPICQEEIST